MAISYRDLILGQMKIWEDWYDIQEKDLKLFHSEDPYYCEVPEAFEFLDDIDNVIWDSTDSGHRRDAICFKSEHVIWTFADVRG